MSSTSAFIPSDFKNSGVRLYIFSKIKSGTNRLKAFLRNLPKILSIIYHIFFQSARDDRVILS